MPKESLKLVCPQCYQIARSTLSTHYVICGYCMKRMVPAPDRPYIVPSRHSNDLFPTDVDAPPEPSLEDLNRSLDDNDLFPTDWDAPEI